MSVCPLFEMAFSFENINIFAKISCFVRCFRCTLHFSVVKTQIMGPLFVGPNLETKRKGRSRAASIHISCECSSRNTPQGASPTAERGAAVGVPRATCWGRGRAREACGGPVDDGRARSPGITATLGIPRPQPGERGGCQGK